MKSIRITFRLTPYQLARGLQTIKQLEPTYQLTSINDMVKTIYHDYLSKMTINKTSVVPQHLINEINAHLKTSTEKLTIENLFTIISKQPSTKAAPLKAEPITETITETIAEPAPELEPEDFYDPNEELSQETLIEIEEMISQTKRFEQLKEAQFDLNAPDSEISTVIDFSPPKDWLE